MRLTRNQLNASIAVVLAIAVIALFFFIRTPLVPSTTSTNTNTQQNSGLIVQDELVGTGASAQAGDTVMIDYTGKLQDGTVFDTSIGKTPFSFIVGAGNVIPGMDQGIVGMKEGGKRLLIIPASLGYGSKANGPIPANSTLVFEVTLLKVTPASATPGAAAAPSSSTKYAPEGAAAN